MPYHTNRCPSIWGLVFVWATVAMSNLPRGASGNIQEPQRRGPCGDLLGVQDGLGLELDVDRAATGQVGGGDEETPFAVDGKLDADRASGREVRGQVQGC